MRGNKGWYACLSREHFGGIFYHEDDNTPPKEDHYAMCGPYLSFTSAREKALDYYRQDVHTAQMCLFEVLLARESNR